jgi:putative membrane protein
MNRNIKTGLIIGGIAAALLVVLPLILRSTTGMQAGCWGAWGQGMMGGLGSAWFVPLLGIVFLGLVIWAAVELIRGLSGSNAMVTTGESRSALDILKSRYARGEISKEEFEARKRDLMA